ncbi:hypothetical protein SDRG_08793 [Saprolegnia diclina VS20]|uniref:Disintegrin domain-containing protein n=1 Tax=Saprolegnia diclina (strain VS20) TaxID=1156394 RepID=T0Q742_SAPDV|nr:hypothetical protein SDRG_08793 [Saprolegnia diclina VS20]EQC33689.1 hypothetical protein SDRG_08793 [Saprolegnia diclina VS20]|eukprot:XP_008612912.1 hypothetical protein SDRG_08793 [Saprolegnia diclina VS20]
MHRIAIVLSALVPIVLASGEGGERGYGGYGGYSGYGGYGSNACSQLTDCVVKPCYIVKCLYGSCVYDKQPYGTKCPGKGDLNNGSCDDDANDFCDDSGQCNDAFKPATHVCRPAANVCDVPELCDGSCSFCPTDQFAAKKTVCSSIGASSGGLCDSVDYCDGRGRCVDGFRPAGSVCRAAVDVCDVPETCSGKTGACPANKFAAQTTVCTAIGKSSGGLCDCVDYCNGRGKCIDSFKPTGTVCRAATDVCDVAETCSGASGVCPADAFAPKTTACTSLGKSTGGDCDDVDYCNGNGKCVDGFKPKGSVCRAAANVCDVAETCNGSNGNCPSNAFAPKTTVCTSIGKSTGGLCDGVDYCDGDGCCIDGFRAAGGVCRAAVNVCDKAETCSGKSGACPSDSFAKKGTDCSSIGLSSGRLCNEKDTCDGRGCCVETYKPAGTVCRPAASECDVPEVCPGNSGVCPKNAFAPSTKACNGKSTGGACDGDDTCDGNGACVDKYLDAHSLCYHKQGVCDGNVFCDGTSAVCPVPKAYTLLTAQALRSCATSVSRFTSTSLASLYEASVTRYGVVLLVSCLCVSALAVFVARKARVSEDDAFAYYLET